MIEEIILKNPVGYPIGIPSEERLSRSIGKVVSRLTDPDCFQKGDFQIPLFLSRLEFHNMFYTYILFLEKLDKYYIGYSENVVELFELSE